MTGTILLTGGTGFIGAAALAALRRQREVRRIRLLVHRTPVPAQDAPPAGPHPTATATAAPGAVSGPAPGAVLECVRADLAHPASLAGICDGVGTLVHLASRIGGDELSCQAVNHHGTAALVAEARRAGVARIVLLSTAAVYGDGVFRGPAEADLTPAPVSPTSRSRLDAERVVRAAGGTVLRPQFVLGPGDAWVGPTLLGILAALGHWVDGGRALLSVIRVDELARLIAAAATAPRLRPAAVHHANHPRPVPVREVAAAALAFTGRSGAAPAIPQTGPGAALAGPGDVPAEPVLPAASLPLAAAQRLLPAPFTPRQLRLLFTDHWFDSSGVWRELDLSPPPDPLRP